MNKIFTIGSVLLASVFFYSTASADLKTIVCQKEMNKETLANFYSYTAEQCKKYPNSKISNYCERLEKDKGRAQTCKKSGLHYTYKKTFIFDTDSDDDGSVSFSEGFTENCWSGKTSTEKFRRVTTPSKIEFLSVNNNYTGLFSIDRQTLEGGYIDQKPEYTCEVVETLRKNKI